MKRIATTLCLAVFAFGAASCATTGDPTQGGLFGWSEGQAQQRIHQREATLQELDAANARGRQHSRQLEQQEYESQRELGSYRY